MTVDKETILVLIIAMVKNTNLDILIAKLIPSLMLSPLSLSLSLSLRSLLKWPLYVFRLSNPYNIASWARCIIYVQAI